MPEGHKSLAVEVILQPAEKSFTEDELKAISERIVAAAAKLGRDAPGLTRGTSSSALIARVDRGLDLVALQAGRDRLAEAEGDDSRPLDEALARPQPAAVERDRHDRQLQRAIEAGEARLERRLLARRQPACPRGR